MLMSLLILNDIEKFQPLIDISMTSLCLASFRHLLHLAVQLLIQLWELALATELVEISFELM